MTATAKPMKCGVKVSRIQAGYWARTMWDDVGARDGIIVSVDKEYKSARMYMPFDDSTCSVNFEQIQSVGKLLSARDSGL